MNIFSISDPSQDECQDTRHTKNIKTNCSIPYTWYQAGQRRIQRAADAVMHLREKKTELSTLKDFFCREESLQKKADE